MTNDSFWSNIFRKKVIVGPALSQSQGRNEGETERERERERQTDKKKTAMQETSHSGHLNKYENELYTKML